MYFVIKRMCVFMPACLSRVSVKDSLESVAPLALTADSFWSRGGGTDREREKGRGGEEDFQAQANCK